MSASVCVSVSVDLWVDLEVRGHPSERGDLNHLILVGGERSCWLGGDRRWLCSEIRHTVNTHKNHNTSKKFQNRSLLNSGQTVQRGVQFND